MKYLILIIFFMFNPGLNSQTPQIKWWFDTFDSSYGQSAAGDIDNDGKDEIVFGCYRNDSNVYALNAEDGSLLWKYNTSGLQEGCNDAAPLIFDVDNDGRLDVVVASSCNPFTYCFDGLTGAVKWKTASRGSDSPPSVADIDGDGQNEILHGEMGGYILCLNAIDGSVKWEILVDPDSWVQTAPTIVDLDGDGMLDFVAATWSFNDASKLYAYKGSDNSLLWSLDMKGLVYHGTAVADIDNDGKTDLMLGDYSGTLWAVNAADGSVKWTFNSATYIGSPVVTGDLDDDGYCDIVFTSASKVYALKNDGSILWQYDIPNFKQSFRGAALSDIDNDGLPDVIFGTQGGLLISLKGTNGSEISRVDLETHYGDVFSIDHAPVIADFDKDGILDAFIVGGHTDYPEFSTNYGRGYAVSLGIGKGPEWKMFQFDNHRTGSICGIPSDARKTSEDGSVNVRMDNKSDRIFITGNKLLNQIYIYDLKGRIISITNPQNENCDVKLSQYLSGVYIIKIGEKSYKIMKE